MYYMTFKKKLIMTFTLFLFSLFAMSTITATPSVVDNSKQTIIEDDYEIIHSMNEIIQVKKQQLNNIDFGDSLEVAYEDISNYGWDVSEIVQENQPLSDLAIAVDGDGNTHVFWAGRMSNDWLLMHKIRFDENGTWSDFDNMGEISDQLKGVLDVKSDDLGRIHLVWKIANKIYYKNYNSDNHIWTDSLEIGNGYDPVLLLNNENVPRIGYTRTLDYRIYYFYAKLNPEFDHVTIYSVPLSYYSTWSIETSNFNFGIIHEDGKESAYFIENSVIQHGYHNTYYTLDTFLYYQENNTASFQLIGFLQEEIDSSQYFIAKPIILGSNDSIVHFFYQKPIDSYNFQYIYLRRTPDHNFQSPVILTTKMALNCQLSATIEDTGRIILTWNHVVYDTFTTAKIYVKTYSSNSNSWSSDQNLTNGDFYSQFPTISLDCIGNLHMVWIDQLGNNRTIYYRKGYVDSDEDGLIDIEETDLYGTDPYDADTDDDMFFDGQEINGIYDPGHPNATGDYLYFDPFDPDEDSDGMYDGYEYLYELNPFIDDSALDFDNDNLTNLEEFQILTLPNNNDTDGDLVDDYSEVKVYFSDPKDTDSDNDGVNDGQEINEVNSNPNWGDTDNDTMTDWYEYIYRSYVDINVNDTTADPDFDGLINLFEFQWNINPGKADHDDDGLNDGDEVLVWGTHPIEHDTDADGIWDGPEVHGQYKPLNVGANATGYVHTNPLLQDSDADFLLDASELLVNTDPNNNDSDGDVMFDGYEYIFGLDYHNASDKNLDYDEDGLSNFEEFQLWTDPFDTDTDDDKFNDFEEIALGIDPAKADGLV